MRCLMTVKNLDQVTAVEVAFMVFTAGFMLDEFAASHEHGWVGACPSVPHYSKS